MKHVVSALSATVLLVALVVGIFSFTSPEPPAQAADVVECEVVSGPVVRVVCTAAGVVVLNTVLDVPSATVTLPGATVTLPGETKTIEVPGKNKTITLPPQAQAPSTVRVPPITVTPAPVTETVRIPAPTVTKTAPPKPRATVTKRVEVPGKTTTLTSAPETTTITPSPTASGQDRGGSASIEPKEKKFFSLEINPGDDNITAGEAGLGILGLLAIIGLFFLGVYTGYYLGFRNKEVDDTHFMRAMRDSILTREH